MLSLYAIGQQDGESKYLPPLWVLCEAELGLCYMGVDVNAGHGPGVYIHTVRLKVIHCRSCQCVYITRIILYMW